MAIGTHAGKAKKVSDILEEEGARKERKKPVTVYLPISLYRKLRLYCFDHETSMSTLLSDMCKERMDKEGQQAGR